MLGRSWGRISGDLDRADLESRLGRSWADLGPNFGDLEPVLGHLRRLPILSLAWAALGLVFGPSSAIVGLSWAICSDLGTILAHLRRSLAEVGPGSAIMGRS